jgi:flagella basal body P-ring formation protein FlgA
MKKIIFAAVAFLITATFQKSAAQDSTQQYQLSQLLSQYYNIKDALVAGNGSEASAKAIAFIKTANSIDYKLVSEGNINAFLKDASPISDTKDVKVQREHFANLSVNMATLAKGLKLSDQPVYQAYCPMKKAYWLSSDKAIKNPYFGNAMLTCGKVVDTINK